MLIKKHNQETGFETVKLNDMSFPTPIPTVQHDYEGILC